MNYATIMVHLQLGRSNANLLKLAGDLAERFHAGVIGIAACQPIQISCADGFVYEELFAQDRDERAKEDKAAKAEFETALHGRGTALEWRSTVSFAPLSHYLAHQVRSADLFITGLDPSVSAFDTSRRADIGDLLMQLGRPLLIVPDAVETLKLEQAVVAWKDTREARRAASDALLLLKRAKRVTVVEIGAEGELAEIRTRLQDVVGWLKRHGITAASIASPSIGDDGGRLCAIADEQGADLVIAGAYGHNRLREWVLGGVTRELLRTNRCSLLSH